MEQDPNAKVDKNAVLFLTDGLKEAWRNFIDKFQESFDLVQLDSVLSMLRELDSSSQNSTKKKRLELKQKGNSESEDNNDSSSLEKKVFGNHLLAKSVFKYLPHSDLLSCRLMSTYWNEYATEVLLKSDFNIKFARKINRFYLSGSNWKSLDMFTELLKRSKNFPCNKFVFNGGNLGNDDARRFFSFYGSSIKFIGISFDDGQYYVEHEDMDNEKGFSPYLTDSRVLGMILSQHLPNLEHFKLDLNFQGPYQGWIGHKSVLFPPKEEVKLPNLKKLTYDSDGRRGDDAFLRQLLKAATNLTSFEKQNELFDLMDDLGNFTATGKVNCISDLSFPTEAEELDKLEEVVKYEPKLVYLSLKKLSDIYKKSETWKRISVILTNLLESSKKSVTTINGFKSLGFLRHLQLPVLENVTGLCLTTPTKLTLNPQDLHDYSFSFLPRGATFSKNFPRLNSLLLELPFKEKTEISDDDADEWWLKCFPTDEIVPTVKEFHLYGSCPILWMENFSKMFPNLEKLHVFIIMDFPNFSKVIWTHYKKLNSLKIGIEMNSPLNSYPALDSSFTGLSPEVCKQLGELSTSELESVAENYMENHEPSLLDLTELRRLKINLQFSDALNYKYAPILTPLTGICAFKPMESLRQVNIKFSKQNLQKMAKKSIMKHLELLTPYKVKIEVTEE